MPYPATQPGNGGQVFFYQSELPFVDHANSSFLNSDVVAVNTSPFSLSAHSSMPWRELNAWCSVRFVTCVALISLYCYIVSFSRDVYTLLYVCKHTNTQSTECSC